MNKFEWDGTISETHTEEINGEIVTVIEKFELFAVSMVPLENAMFPFRNIEDKKG